MSKKKSAPVHPGEVLREEFMLPFKLTMNGLAHELRIPTTRVSEIWHERRGITTDTALRLARYFGTTPQFWMNLQVQYDLDEAEDDYSAQVNRDVRPRKLAIA